MPVLKNIDLERARNNFIGVLTCFNLSDFVLGTPMPRILLTAPSNAAVDEIARKLIHCYKKLKPEDKLKMKMMRIGQPNTIHPEVKGKDYTPIWRKI